MATQRALNSTLPSFFEAMHSFSDRVILSHYDDGDTKDKAAAVSTDTHRKADASGDGDSRERGISKINSRGVSRSSAAATGGASTDERTTHGLEVGELVVEVGRDVRAFSSRTSESDLSAVPKEDVFELETFVIQSVLVNAYLLLLNHPSTSFLVKSQVAAHLKEVNAGISKILLDIDVKYLNDAASFQAAEKEAHLRLLSSSISAGKPFLNLLSIPLGPPI